MSERIPLLLALHSSTDTLAVGLQPLGGGLATVASHPLGRSLGNELLVCVERQLPASRWSELGRLAVATGPGGFTGTRLSVVLARTLAQQLGCPLDGFSSFLLCARCLWLAGESGSRHSPFWVTQVLPRRGVVAGRYQADSAALGGLAEMELPRLFPSLSALSGAPCFEARLDPAADLSQLLLLSQAAAAAGRPAPWQPVLPIYPTSPVLPA
ncbi:tRNA (adenosine(37)-N6)-threonylcarbamoyltransferase complex dimerization subunit type 1 TsaB [Synechococcus sp. CS-1325]|uniref:tRNA (adenosine(37)-N6)-threonylcarbamoyltransferase complex dimerization subunit type 1 TsaB n=1 Tax=unclassified Synechococcus TaxID=2626047 RepID=UPI000DB8EB05|nr:MULTISPECIES: tRNA (adenosine(37)-N6)-threonylcarbamoyltransferase complex dimerization subunit type 1 TsaB [unclassified Synechococcus]MCT0198113.1 tRNA (adenosine(37)-N6)-threonylcarbamoyltransferase complex dimerization subunit type 1 TsaB [Synechococcus sp. CS-1325]MCT0229679.1 tRNA (adenosine(37)-N6)-threonylcarbamoyltransferase complex dimerization subunit type 1 TsaB [Synechococcus sp. CS-1324]PZV00907.1 MAG: tRNA (adenosine(37)-N6)-threonylcarbamoyltransferase complex dimerization sub